MNKITLGLEGRVAESRGPREGPAREAGTQGRERAASGEVAAAEAWEPHGHGGFKLTVFDWNLDEERSEARGRPVLLSPQSKTSEAVTTLQNCINIFPSGWASIHSVFFYLMAQVIQ